MDGRRPLTNKSGGVKTEKVMLYLLAVSPFCSFSIMSCCLNVVTMVNEQQ